MRFTRYFLDSYDNCKQGRSAPECRESVASAAPIAVRTYLASYDACLKLFGQETCRRFFVREEQRVGAPGWAILAGLVLGFLIGRSSRKK